MLEVRDLNVTYTNGVKALTDVNVQIPEGSLCGIIGPNGGGKTTFLKGILGFVPHRGKTYFRGKPIKKSAKHTAYVEQKGKLDMDFPITVIQCVLLGTYPQLGFFKNPGEVQKNRAQKALERVGLKGFENRQIGALSGGQFQRVLIARTLAQEADLIILDEPFVGIDVNSEKIIIHLLQELCNNGKTILVVHHDLSKVKDYFDYLLFIHKTIIAAGPVEEVFEKDNLSATFNIYDKALLV